MGDHRDSSQAEKMAGKSISALINLQLELGSIIKNMVDNLIEYKTIDPVDLDHYNQLMQRRIKDTLSKVPKPDSVAEKKQIKTVQPGKSSE